MGSVNSYTRGGGGHLQVTKQTNGQSTVMAFAEYEKINLHIFLIIQNMVAKIKFIISLADFFTAFFRSEVQEKCNTYFKGLSESMHMLEA